MVGADLERGFPYDAVVEPGAARMDAEALSRVGHKFEAQQRRGRFPGGQLVVRRAERKVLEVACGVARGFRPEEGRPPSEVTARTRFPTLSAGKPLVAMGVALLEERALLDVYAPIATLWPEFAAHGKEQISTLDVLTHRSGIFLPELRAHPQRWSDWAHIVEEIERARPSVPPGTLAYAPYEYGWILAEVVRRASGRELRELLATELTGPAGLEGLTFGARPEELGELARPYWTGTRRTVIAGAELSTSFERVQNRPEVLTAFVPGAGLVTDAASLAGFYQVLVEGGVAPSGRRVLRADTIRRYTLRQVFGWDRSARVPLAVGCGFLTGTPGPNVYGWRRTQMCFGHAGAFSVLAFGDYRTGVSAAFVTNGNAGPLDLLMRCAPLAQAIRDACE